jgi:hypothetical protein
MDLQILPKVGGLINVSIQVRLLVKEQSFTREQVRSLNVLPTQQLTAVAPAADKKTILVISAAPRNYGLIRTDKEMNRILFELKHRAPKRESFEVDVLPAATWEEARKKIVYLQPYLIHFAGHGTPRGIVLENENEMADLVLTEALLALLKPLSAHVECVILNACETLDSAEQLAECIPHVIGMRNAILDPAAIAFSECFYEAIGAGLPIEGSFELGKAGMVRAYSTADQNPVLYRQGQAL